MRTFAFFVCTCITWFCGLLHQSQAMHDSLVVSITGGLVQGMRHKGSVRFLGLPYGTAQRFQVPAPMISSWQGIVNASEPGPQCLQQCPPVIRDLYCLPDNKMSENCLTLNVYRPAYNLPAGGRFPVMVFIHGGEFQSGSGAAPLYDGEFLARTGGVIVVTINYRLGALGFLPIFNQYDDVMGNFGIRDQELALRWIQNNIAAFDGDPNQVTLFGTDAGCQSVALHLTHLSARNLFQSAILQSCPFTLPFRNKNEARRVVKRFASALGCEDNDLACYREKSAEEILRAQRDAADQIRTEGPSLFQFQAWGPIIDQRIVHDSNLLQELLAASRQPGNAKPIMLGFVEEEGRTSVYRNFPLPISSDFFQVFVQKEFPDKWQQIANSADAPYQTGTKQDARNEMVQLLNDYTFVCPARRVAGAMSTSAVSKRNVWMYSFEPVVTWSPGGSAWPPGGESYCRDVACHGLDLLYLFNPPAVPESRRPHTEALSRQLAVYWTNFAKYGNPNGEDSGGTSLASNSIQAAQGSLVSRIRQLVAQTAAATSPQPDQRSWQTGRSNRPASLPGSLVRIVQVSSLAARQPTPTATQPRPATFWAPGPAVSLPVPFMTFPNRPATVTVTSVPAPPATSSVNWPPYVAGHNSNLVAVHQTLVLTQPSPFSRQSIFDQRCGFWENIGY